MMRFASRRKLRPLRSVLRSFTIVELAVTVAILGILCGVVIDAGIREWRREQVTTLVVELAGWLESVRRNAIKGYSCTVTVKQEAYATGAVLASVSASNAPDGRCGTVSSFQIVGLHRSPGFLVKLPSGDAPISFTFTPAGTLSPPPAPDAPIVIPVSLNDDNPEPSRCLMLDGMVGLIDVGIYRGGICAVGQGF